MRKNTQSTPPHSHAFSEKPPKPLERYAQILEAIAASNGQFGVAEISSALNLPKATAYRLLEGLAESQLIAPSPIRAGAFVLASRMIRLAHIGDDGTRAARLCEPLLTELAEAVGLTSFIAKLVGTEVTSLAVMTPSNLSGIFFAPGYAMMPHVHASAKAIWAYQPEADILKVLAKPLPALTSKTKTVSSDVVAEYALIRRQGWAVCDGEENELIGALSVPLRNSAGTYYSVGVTGAINRVLGPHHGGNLEVMQRFAKAFETVLYP